MVENVRFFTWEGKFDMFRTLDPKAFAEMPGLYFHGAYITPQAADPFGSPGPHSVPVEGGSVLSLRTVKRDN